MYTIFIILAVLVALVFIGAVLSRKQYHISRNVSINASRQKVFDYVKLLKNQDNFNKWVMADPMTKKEFSGTDGTVGFIYAWNGKKSGEGEQEIINILEGKKIETEIRFVRPFPSIAYADMVIESESDTQTKLTWSNASTMKYPINIMLPMIEKMLAKDMDTSLATLKNILEN
ncbi:SRPBCC family protein [Flavobacterium wongokense]|uniref:SRPBCC family protein n=1 Tax=Flavobacterium wongokense TaxID=2910674 RepID=UPI001F1B9901|nr:SRPBCC family protein [Flavobacterium sp. WG47]MCF6133420.1 SRPBCC family protein [Flavobacterium sp. WG47]